jgi:nitroreductase
MKFDPSTRHQICSSADEALLTRQSIRAFLPREVPRETIDDILQVAARAPSGTNTQPWKVYVVAGEPRAELSRQILAAFDDPAVAATHKREYAYYPQQWTSPYVDRRRKVGWDMYGLLGIGKGDFEKTHHQHGRNYSFFDAPVGLMFTIDRILERGSWLDYGMFLEFHSIIAGCVGMPDNEMLVCGMSLGWADPAALINTLFTERDPVASFTTYCGI